MATPRVRPAEKPLIPRPTLRPTRGSLVSPAGIATRATSSAANSEAVILRPVAASGIEIVSTGGNSALSNTEKLSGIFTSLGVASGIAGTPEAAYDSTERIFPAAKEAVRNVKGSGVFRNFTLGAMSLIMSGCTGNADEGIRTIIDISCNTHPALALMAVSVMGTFLAPQTGHIRSIVVGGALFGAAVFGVAGLLGITPLVSAAAIGGAATAILFADKGLDKIKENSSLHNFLRMPYSNVKDLYHRQNLDDKLSAWQKYVGGPGKDFLKNALPRLLLGATVTFPAEVMHDIWDMSDPNPTRAKTARLVYNASLAVYCFTATAGAAIMGLQYLQNVSAFGQICNFLAANMFIIGMFPRLFTSFVFLRDSRHANTSDLAQCSPKTENERLHAVGFASANPQDPEVRKVLPFGEGHKNACFKVSAYEEGAPDQPTKNVVKKVLEDRRQRQQQGGGQGQGGDQHEEHNGRRRDVQPEEIKTTYGMIGRGLWSAFLLISRERDYYIGLGRPIRQPARIPENVSEFLNYKDVMDQVMDWVGALKYEVVLASEHKNAASLRALIEKILAKSREQAEIWKEITRVKNSIGEYFALDKDMAEQWDGNVAMWEKELEKARGWEQGNQPADRIQEKVNDNFEFIDRIFSFDAFMAPAYEWHNVKLGNYEKIRKYISRDLAGLGIDEADVLGNDIASRNEVRKVILESVEAAARDLGLGKRQGDMRAKLNNMVETAYMEGWTIEELLNKVSFEIAVQNSAQVGQKSGIESRAHVRFEKTFVVVESMFTEDYKNPLIAREPDLLLDDMKSRRKQKKHWGAANIRAREGHPDVKGTTVKGSTTTSISLKKYIEVDASEWLKLAKMYLTVSESRRMKGLAASRGITGITADMTQPVSEASSLEIINAVMDAAGIDNNNVKGRRKIISLERMRKEFLKAAAVRGEQVLNSEMLEQALIIAVSGREIEWFPWATKDKKGQTLRVSHMDKDYIWFSTDPETRKLSNVFSEASPVMDEAIAEGDMNVRQVQLNQENAGTAKVGVAAKEGEDYYADAKLRAKEMRIYRFANDPEGHPLSNKLLIFYHGEFRYFTFTDMDLISIGQNADQAPWYAGYPFPLTRRTQRALDEIHVRNQYLKVNSGGQRFVSAGDTLDILLADKKLKALYEGTYGKEGKTIDDLRAAVRGSLGNRIVLPLTDELGREIMGLIADNMKKACIGMGIMPGRDKVDHASFCCGTPRLMDIANMIAALNDPLVQDINGNVIARVHTAYDKSDGFAGANEHYDLEAAWMAHGGKEENVHLSHQIKAKLQLTQAEKDAITAQYNGHIVEFDNDGNVFVYTAARKLEYKFYWYHQETPVYQGEPQSDPARNTGSGGLGFAVTDFTGPAKVMKLYLPRSTPYNFADLPQTDAYRITCRDEERVYTYKVKAKKLKKAIKQLREPRMIAEIMGLQHNWTEADLIRRCEDKTLPADELIEITVKMVLPQVITEYIPPAGEEFALEIPVIPQTMPYDSITEDKFSTEIAERKGLEDRMINRKVGRGEGPRAKPEVTVVQQPRWDIGGAHSSLMEFKYLLMMPSLLFSPKGLRRLSSIFWYRHGWSDHHAFRNLSFAFAIGALLLAYGLVPMFPGLLYMSSMLAYISTGLFLYGGVVASMQAEWRRHPATDVADKEAFTTMNGPAYDTDTRSALTMSGMPFKPTVHSGNKRQENPTTDIEGDLKRIRVTGFVTAACATYFTIDMLSLGAASAFLLAGSVVVGGFSALNLYLIRRHLKMYAGGWTTVKPNPNDPNDKGIPIYVPGTEYFGVRHALPFQGTLGRLPGIGQYFGEANDLGIVRRLKYMSTIKSAAVKVEDSALGTLGANPVALGRTLNDTIGQMNLLIYGNAEAVQEKKFSSKLRFFLRELIKDRRDFTTELKEGPAKAAVMNARNRLLQIQQQLAAPNANTAQLAAQLQATVDNLRSDPALRGEMARLISEVKRLRDEVNTRVEAKALKIFHKKWGDTRTGALKKQAIAAKDELRKLIVELVNILRKDPQAREEARIKLEKKLMREERRRRGIY